MLLCMISLTYKSRILRACPVVAWLAQENLGRDIKGCLPYRVGDDYLGGRDADAINFDAAVGFGLQRCMIVGGI